MSPKEDAIMSRTITAMFDDRSEAERAKSELQQIGATAEIVDQSRLSQGSSGSTSNEGQGYNQTYGNSGATGAAYDQFERSGGGGRGFWADLKDAFVSDDDRSSYEEGVRRGGVLLTAHVDESRADEAVRILDREGTVDMDQREQSWRSEGWQGNQADQRSALGGSSTSDRTAMGTASSAQEEHIPIIEEQLRVGKREVSRGGARVRSYVEETPVDETVRLREEHVHIERRPVDRALTGENLTGDAFQERTVEMTETAEEAVIAKEARVREELVISKTADEREEHIHDTVRHTEVDVDEGLRSERDGIRSDRDGGALFDKNR
jgi:uncharacterized protein (TIGR02271 family)